MRALICPIHGIDSTNSGWVEQFKSFVSQQWPEAVVIEPDYWVGPFPIINNWICDPYVSKALAKTIQSQCGTLPVFFVAHSNGAVIALRTAQLLIAAGKSVGGSVMMAGAIDPDVVQTGLLSNVNAKQLGFAAAYCSKEDDVLTLPGWLMWPYGNMGAVGWQVKGQPYSGHGFLTRWFEGGHSGYFESSQIQSTFTQILQDIKNL